MKAAILDLSGKMAHFGVGKHTNFLSTFCLPSKRTILGLLGAVMGWSKDKYFEVLNNNRLEVSVGILNEYRTIVQTVNLLHYKDNIKESPRHNPQKHLPTPHEYLVAEGFPWERLYYRIFAWNNDEIVGELLKRASIPFYPPCFGLLNCPAQIERAREGTLESIESSGQIDSVCKVDSPDSVDKKARVSKNMPVKTFENGRSIAFEDYYFDIGTLKGSFSNLLLIRDKENEYHVYPM